MTWPMPLWCLYCWARGVLLLAGGVGLRDGVGGGADVESGVGGIVTRVTRVGGFHKGILVPHSHCRWFWVQIFRCFRAWGTGDYVV
jgi:hypothetical protein